MIYDHNKINLEHIPNEFNKLEPFIKFTTEKELQEIHQLLHLTIQHKDNNLKFPIYRNPTQTDTSVIVPNSSCHPYEHKLLSITYVSNNQKNKRKINTIKNIR
jgi:hypothetical protein